MDGILIFVIGFMIGGVSGMLLTALIVVGGDDGE